MKTLLPVDPRRRAAVLVAFLGLAGLYFAYSYVHRPRAERAQALTLRIDQLETNQQLAENHQQLDEAALERRHQTYSSHLARLQALIPERNGVSALLDALSAAERNTGVEVTMLRPEPREPLEHYDRWSYAVAVTGGYHQIAFFVTVIASMDRLMIPTQVHISPAPVYEHDPGVSGALDPSSPGSRNARARLSARFRMWTLVRHPPTDAETSPSPDPTLSTQQRPNVSTPS